MHQLRNKSKWPLARKEQQYLTFHLHLQEMYHSIDSCNKSTKVSRRKAWDILIHGQKHLYDSSKHSPRPKQISNWKNKNVALYLNYHKLLICICFHLNSIVCQATSYKTELILAPFASSVKGKHTRRWGGRCFIKGDYVLPGSITLVN